MDGTRLFSAAAAAGLALAGCQNPFVVEGTVGALTVEGCDGTLCTLRLSLVLDEVSGEPVGGLSVADFTVQELDFIETGVGTFARAREATVTDLSVESIEGPLYASVLLDQSGSIAVLDPDNARLDAIEALLSEGLSSGLIEEAALLSFPRNEELGPLEETDLWQDFTDRSRQLQGALDRLADTEDGGTPLWDSLSETAEHHQRHREALDDETARSVVVVLSDGSDSASSGDVWSALEVLQAAQTPIMVAGLGDDIDFDGLHAVATASGGYFLPTAEPDALVRSLETFTAALSGDVTLTITADLDRALISSAQYLCEGTLLFREDSEIEFSKPVYVSD